MKLECLKENLAGAVAKAERVTGKNLSLPVLSCVLLEAKESSLFVRATNLDLAVEIEVPAKVGVAGRLAAKGAVLGAFLANLSGDKKVILESQETTLVLRTENGGATINTLSSDDFPSLPVFTKDHSLQIQASTIADGLQSVSYSASISSVKPELASVLIHSENNELIFAATDSFRLAEKRFKVKLPKEISQTIIPIKNTVEIARMAEEFGGNPVEVIFMKNQIAFSFQNSRLISRTIDGVFPDYKQIIPKKQKTEAVVLKEDLNRVLKAAAVFSDNFNQVAINVRPDKKKFEISAKNTEVGKTLMAIAGALSGEEIEINFNHRYLTDCLSSIKSDSLIISFGGHNAPAVLRGISDYSFTYLVMPINR
jgi:DNA polymerase-3 subunit beta